MSGYEYLLELYPHSERTTYPSDEITINKMPTVPNAPNGNLSNHSSGNNYTVTDGNINDFFRAVVGEFFSDRYDAPRAANEDRETWEELTHGRVDGYITEKGNWIWQRNNTGSYEQETETTKFDDYSNEGVLYFGGGYGKAGFGRYNYDNYSSSETYEYLLNGRVRFNGKFSGELVFDNFRYKSERGDGNNNYYNRYSHIGGSVKIGNLNVTQKYLDYVIKGISIPGDGTGIIGTFEYSNSWWDDEYEIIAGESITLSFNSNNTGTLAYYGVYEGETYNETENFTYEYDQSNQQGYIFWDEWIPFTFDGLNTVYLEGISFSRK